MKVSNKNDIIKDIETEYRKSKELNIKDKGSIYQ